MEEMHDMDWEAVTPPDNSEQEIAKIRKNMKKQNMKTILTSLILVLALVLGTVFGIIPLVEKIYWNPYDSTLDQYNSDLRLVLQAYTELFLPGKSITVLPGKVGFAEYELHMTMHDVVRDTKHHFTGRMKRGELGFDMEFFDDQTIGFFQSVLFPEYPESQVQKDNEEVREKLQALPEYIRLEAAITFPEDISMEQLLTTMEYDPIGNQEDLATIWAAIRTQTPRTGTVHNTVGISFVLQPNSGGINDTYPEFMLSYFDPSGVTLEEHFKSLLHFSSDMMPERKAVVYWSENHNFYQEALSYVEENGVKAYGCIVTGSPQTLLALLDSGDILDMQLIDAWIDVE